MTSRILPLVVLLSACDHLPNLRPCDDSIQVVDEIDGQVRLGDEGSCSVDRVHTYQMTRLELEPGSDDPCAVTSSTVVYWVDGLGGDLDFGPSDPPDDAETSIDQTHTLEVGDWVEAAFWGRTSLGSGLSTQGPWIATFQWGVPDSVTDVSCRTATSE